MKRFIILLGIINLLFVINARAQWQVHLPYYNATAVCKLNNTVYCATQHGFFSFNEDDRSLTKLSKINGFSDVEISAINASNELNTLIIAYENSNIDLVKNNEIINISDLKDKQITGNKQINSILFVNDYAYLACGFGIIKLNIEKNEIADTYYIAENGEKVNVSQVVYDGTYLYAATENGIYKIEENHPQIINYANWQKLTDFPYPNKKFKSIGLTEGKLYTLMEYSPDSTILYRIESDFSANSAIAENIYKKNKVKESGNELFIFADTALYMLNKQTGEFEFQPAPKTYPDPRDILVENERRYIADDNRGLIVRYDENNVGSYVPNGPHYVQFFDLDISENIIWGVRGGRESNMGGSGYGGFAYYNAENYWRYTYDNSVYDWTNVIIDPQDPTHVYIGSVNYGITEIKDYKIVKKYNHLNYEEHTLQTVIEGGVFVRITGLDFDENNNLWISNYYVPEPISVLTKEGNWKSFSFENTIKNTGVKDIICTKNGNKWVVIRREGLFVFNENGTIDDESDDLFYKFKLTNSEGVDLLSNDIYAIAEDNDGVIWLGTDKGIIVYYNPENVFENREYFYASQIVIDVDGVAKYLLETEIVTSIDVDGANRKWIGTDGAGVFLLSEDGTQELAHFTNENSPLLSNSISKIKINQNTGEVYIATSKGLITYKAKATQPNTFFTDVYAYPNPVRENYDGDITITGLVEDTNVKITDISGNFVYETTSLGGQAVWNGKNLNGERVKTGVYIVFLSNDDGTKTAVTKILFIN